MRDDVTQSLKRIGICCTTFIRTNSPQISCFGPYSMLTVHALRRIFHIRSIVKTSFRRSFSMDTKVATQSLSTASSSGKELPMDYGIENQYKADLTDGFLKVYMPASTLKPAEILAHNTKKENESNSKKGTNETNESKPETDCIPETVLQYERQLRKIQAAKRASSPLVKSQVHIEHNDKNIVVANKPSGVLTVPGINSNPSLLSFLHQEYNSEIEDNMLMEHMIIHRLDMDTSGIVIFAKDKQSMSALQKAFRERNVDKQYETLVCGHLPLDIESGSINLPLQRDHRFPPFMRVATPESERQAQIVVKDLNHAGWKKIIKKNPKQSETLFRVIRRESIFSEEQQKHLPVTRLQLTPVTGRTHQLRVHCAAIGHPIFGDPAYGVMGEASPNGGFEEETMCKMMPGRATIQLQLSLDKHVKEFDRCMCLHARKLALNHPISAEAMVFEYPPDF